MHVFVTLFWGTTGNCILVDSTVSISWLTLFHYLLFMELLEVLFCLYGLTVARNTDWVTGPSGHRCLYTTITWDTVTALRWSPFSLIRLLLAPIGWSYVNYVSHFKVVNTCAVTYFSSAAADFLKTIDNNNWPSSWAVTAVYALEDSHLAGTAVMRRGG